jgi:hypothetical protein
MKRIILLAIVVWSFLAVNSAAQRGAMRGAGAGAGALAKGTAPPARPISPVNPIRGAGATYPRLYTNGYWGRGSGRAPYGGFGYGGFGYLASDYSSYFSGFAPEGDYASYAPGGNQMPGVVVVMPQVQAPPPPPPPPPANPVIHEYKWPDTTSNPTPTFSVATRSGPVWAAIVVWAQDGFLSLVTPDGIAKKMPLQMIDRALTQRLNAKNGLTLWLPPVVEP